MVRLLASCLNATRSVLLLSGADSLKFLQGYVTHKLAWGASSGCYGALLNVQGRVLADVFTYYSHPQQTIAVEATKGDTTSSLQAHLARYVLRSQVAFQRGAEAGWGGVWAVWSEGEGECDLLSTSTTEATSAAMIVRDERAIPTALRCLTPSEKPPSLPGVELEVVPAWRYHARRIELGVPEGPVELPAARAFPFECNLDYMRGVHFDKGCYLGQELTARTFFRGVTRKRVYPVQFFTSLEDLRRSEAQAGVQIDPSVNHELLAPTLAGSPLQRLKAASQPPSQQQQEEDASGSSGTGAVLSVLHNIGLASVRDFDDTEASLALEVVVRGGSGLWARAFRPAWWKTRGTGKK